MRKGLLSIATMTINVCPLNVLLIWGLTIKKLLNWTGLNKVSICFNWPLNGTKVTYILYKKKKQVEQTSFEDVFNLNAHYQSKFVFQYPNSERIEQQLKLIYTLHSLLTKSFVLRNTIICFLSQVCKFNLFCCVVSLFFVYLCFSVVSIEFSLSFCINECVRYGGKLC